VSAVSPMLSRVTGGIAKPKFNLARHDIDISCRDVTCRGGLISQHANRQLLSFSCGKFTFDLI